MPSVARTLGVAMLVVAGCGSRVAEPDAGHAPRDSGELDSGTNADAAASTDASSAPARPCVAEFDCDEWWDPTAAFCDVEGCCAGRLDRFGCICGDRRGGCQDWQYCCDDVFHPEIIVGCRDRPCDAPSE